MRPLGAIAVTLALLTGGCGGKTAHTIPIPEGKTRDLSVEQLLQKGRALMERRKYFRARETLERIQSRPEVTRELLAEVNLLIADAYYHNGGIINLAEALSRYTSFLTFYPTHPRADYAQYQLGLSYFKQALAPDKDQDTTLKALEAFREVERQHPGSEWVGPAREEIRKCTERLAESEMRVGLFYVKRDAWSGAIERFRTILEKYPLYSRLDRTYFELARALESDDRRDEALIYYEQMLERFPDSRYASEARGVLMRENRLPETAEASRAERSSENRAAQPPRLLPGGRSP